MFELNFKDFLDPDHELLRAAELIDWDELHDAMSTYYSILGRHGKPIRLMVGIHILKHYYNCSDERAVEQLHENAYWQCFSGFTCFQRGQILDATSLVKFRNRIGIEGMRRIEAVFLNHWQELGLIKTRRVCVDTTVQEKNIAYPTDADLLFGIREKIVQQVKKVREAVGFRKPFRSFARTGKKLLLHVKKLYRNKPQQQERAIKQLMSMTNRVTNQAARMANSLYARGHQDLGRKLNQLVSVGHRIVTQTQQVLKGQKPVNRLYSLHEHKVCAIKKGKANKSCEFGSLVSLNINDDGVILSHAEYQRNIGDAKTVGTILNRMETNTGKRAGILTADRGFDQSYKKQNNCRRCWGVSRLAIPKKGKHPHRDSHNPWFKQALKQRVKIEPVIGHLKTDHRMGRCYYKGPKGDTANVVWAAAAWNVKKANRLNSIKQKKAA